MMDQKLADSAEFRVSGTGSRSLIQTEYASSGIDTEINMLALPVPSHGTFSTNTVTSCPI